MSFYDPVRVEHAGAAPVEEAFESLRAPHALAALYRLCWDHDVVHTLASNYSSWAQLAGAGYASIATVLGPRSQMITVPALPATEPEMPGDVEMVTRYSLNYPATLREVSSPPAVLYVRGSLPAGPAVAIGGAEHPSPQGVEIARSAALAAVAQRRPVVVLLADGVGVTALRSAVAASGRVVVVVPHGLDRLSKHDLLLEEVLENGGAVISEVPGGVGVSEHFTAASARLVAAMSSAVVLAEVGRHVTAGAPLARAAIGAGRYLVVPNPQQHYVPESALGLRVLTQTRAFSDAWYGSSPRIDSRVANGLSPADAVVGDQREIAHAIAVACRSES